MAQQNTPGVGVEYEISVPAYFALNLNNNSNVKEFSIRSNVAVEFGNMDDVIIDVDMADGTRRCFAIQLKHKEKRNKKLLPANFEAKGNFSLEKYCKAFKEIEEKNKHFRFILYTNSEYNSKSKEQLKNFRIIEDDGCPGRHFFETSCKPGNVYKFEVNDNTPTEGDVVKEDYEEFFRKFTVYVGQKNFEDLEEEIFGILKNRGATLSYLSLFRKWHQSRFTNKTIDRETINLHLVDIFLSDLVITDRRLPINQKDNFELFENIVRKFDITVIDDSKEMMTSGSGNGEESENLVSDCIKNSLKQYTEECKIDPQKLHHDPKGSLFQCMLYLGKKYKIIDRTTHQLDACTKKKILYYFFEELFFIDFNKSSEESIYRLFDLYQMRKNPIKFVFVGAGVDSSRLPKFTVFENLDNLQNHEALYLEVTNKCQVSLQGKDCITLARLINTCGRSDFVGVREILQMLQENFVVGEEREILPVNYIHRTVSTFVLNLEKVLSPSFVLYNTLIINFDGQLEQMRKKFEEQAINIMNIEDFLVLQEFPKKPTVISAKNELPMQLFKEILRRTFSGNLLHLRTIDSNTFVPVIVNIKDRSCFNAFVIEEERVHEFFNNRINILSAQPGMGKSTMLKVLKNQLSDCWTVMVDLKAHNMFLKTKRPIDEVLDYFTKDSRDSFSEKINAAFLEKKKMVFFFDGLDELDTNCIDNVLDYCEDLSNLGLHVWVSARQNLEHKMTSRFSKYSISIVEVSQDEQKQYIKDRLCNDYEDPEIEQLTTTIFSSSDMVNNRQVLGIPLQLYIITQIFLDDKDQFYEMTKNIFVLTRMYRFYFDGRYKHTIDKQESKNPHLVVGDKEDHFEKYEILALQSLLDDDIFTNLSLDTRRSRRFLEEIKKRKDLLGIVVKVNSESKAVFDHFTYAEYFACSFLAYNFDKVRILREVLFSDRYKNLLLILNVMLAEDNPLHLAVIYKDLKQIEKYSNDANMCDRGGRTPLHLAVSHCLKYPGCLTLGVERWSLMMSKFLIYTGCLPYDIKGCCFRTLDFITSVNEIINNRSLLKYVVKFDPLQHDKLFNWNCLDYAFVTQSLVAVDIILSKHEVAENTSKHIEEYKNHPPFLSFCVLSGSVNLLAAILGENSISNVSNCLKMTYLHDAINFCYFHKLELVRFLLDHGADINYVYQDLAPLQLATRKKYLDVIKLLIEFEATIAVTTPNGDNLLHLSVENESGSDENSLAENVAQLDDGDFGASCLVECSNVNLLEFFIDKGLSVNSKNKNGETPLHLAVARGDLEVVHYLCDKNVDIEDVAEEEQTLLHYAIVNSRPEVLEFMLTKISDVNIRNGRGETPLLRAVTNNNSSAVKFLLDKGADSTICDKQGLTPLHYAATTNRYDLVKLFVNNGVNSDEIRFLYSTTRSKCIETISRLSPKYFNINAGDENGLTLLHIACQMDFEITKLLIQKGANVNLLTQDGVHPLHFAVDGGNAAIVETILQEVDFAQVERQHGKYSLTDCVRDGCLQKDLILEMAGTTSNGSSKDITLDGLYKLLQFVDMLNLRKK